MRSYADMKRGLAEAERRIAEEQRENLPKFDHMANWKLVNELIEMGLRNQPPMRTESGLVEYRRRMDAIFAKKAQGGTGE